ncbi:MAG: DUF5058 family protein [Lachnospiraceae bacterium]
MDNFQSMANDILMFILCLIPIILVLAQAAVCIKMGISRSKELGVDQKNVKKAITNSAIFSILPSLPIVITVVALMPSLGKYIPWLRLSVIGSAAYESACADMTMVAFGYSGLGDTTMTESVFTSVIWVMCLVSCVWPLVNVIGLKFYDVQVKKARKTGGFMKVASGAMMIGLMCVMCVPRLANVKDVTGIIVCAVAGVSALILDWIAGKYKLKSLSDFSFALAMIIGMISAVIVS